MALTKLYPTANASGTPTVLSYAMDLSLGTAGTHTVNTTANSFTALRDWVEPIAAGKEILANSNISVSLDVSAVASSIICRFRLSIYRLVSLAYQLQDSSSYSSEFSTTGIKTATLSIPTTAIANDYIVLRLEGYRSAGHSTSSATIRIHDADTFIEPDITDAVVTRRIFIS